MPTARTRDQIEHDLTVIRTRTLDDLLEEWLQAEVLRPSQVLADPKAAAR